MNTISVREHARLTVGPVAADSLDVASVPASAFDWLCRESQRHRAAGAPLVQLEDRHWLRVDNHVGVLETPCGTRIEILPKHVQGETDVATARKVLVRMLRAALDLPVRESGPTALETFNAPVSEWIIQCFLQELNGLVRRGLRFDYRVVEEEVRFLRGRLRVAQQVRQPPTRRHLFQVEHQVFDPNRPENRLIAKALANEVSVLTARSHDGASVVYPIAENVHRDGILFPLEVAYDPVQSLDLETRASHRSGAHRPSGSTRRRAGPRARRSFR